MLRKNKPKAKQTMNDFIKANQSDNPMDKQVKIAQTNIHAFKYTDTYMEQVVKYNENIQTIDPLYESVKPLHEILVRFYLHEPTKVGELVMPYKQMIPIETKSGIAGYNEVESDFPFTMKAVVISAPESNPLKTGDVVFLSRKAIMIHAIGNGANAKIVVAQSFCHPDSNLADPPTDITNQHYGYAMIQYHEIKAKL